MQNLSMLPSHSHPKTFHKPQYKANSKNNEDQPQSKLSNNKTKDSKQQVCHNTRKKSVTIVVVLHHVNLIISKKD